MACSGALVSVQHDCFVVKSSVEERQIVKAEAPFSFHGVIDGDNVVNCVRSTFNVKLINLTNATVFPFSNDQFDSRKQG